MFHRIENREGVEAFRREVNAVRDQITIDNLHSERPVDAVDDPVLVLLCQISPKSSTRVTSSEKPDCGTSRCEQRKTAADVANPGATRQRRQ